MDIQIHSFRLTVVQLLRWCPARHQAIRLTRKRLLQRIALPKFCFWQWLMETMHNHSSRSLAFVSRKQAAHQDRGGCTELHPLRGSGQHHGWELLNQKAALKLLPRVEQWPYQPCHQGTQVQNSGTNTCVSVDRLNEIDQVFGSLLGSSKRLPQFGVPKVTER